MRKREEERVCSGRKTAWANTRAKLYNYVPGVPFKQMHCPWYPAVGQPDILGQKVEPCVHGDEQASASPRVPADLVRRQW